jgi:hypothetical protein
MKPCKDMTSVYFNMTSKELRTLRSKKKMAILKAEQYGNYWALKDRTCLWFQIERIDAVLASRDAQLDLFE